jgi:hypothetical protein
MKANSKRDPLALRSLHEAEKTQVKPRLPLSVSYQKINCRPLSSRLKILVSGLETAQTQVDPEDKLKDYSDRPI